MLIGYSILDPVVVSGFTLYCLWLLSQSPVRLFLFFPAVLSLYFIIPSITLITLWQTVPALLFLRGVFGRGLKFPPRLWLGLQLLLVVVALSVIWPLFAGGDLTRALIRLFYFITLFSLFSFSYELGSHPKALRFLISGLIITGIVYSLYGVYQLIAVRMGLPVRGIVYGDSPVSLLPVQGAFARINSFANEPKRLGYVLFLASLASFYTAVASPRKIYYIIFGLLSLAVSFFTFSTSFFAAVLVFLVLAATLQPKYAVLSLFLFGLLAGFLALFSLDSLIDAFSGLFDARLAELEIGIDGRFVYRQEFFAFDLLGKDPLYALFGVGLGQYFRVLSGEYGFGVGIGLDGRTLLPLNSVPLELIFDLGLIVAVVVYAWLARLVLRLRGVGEYYLSLSLLFLLIQSFWIQTSLFIAVVAGLGLARLELRNKVSVAPLHPLAP
jgi:hypothetical protein